jgi:hypothetical protein
MTIRLSRDFSTPGARSRWILVREGAAQTVVSSRAAAEEALNTDASIIRVTDPTGKTLITRNPDGSHRWHHLEQSELEVLKPEPINDRSK